MKPVISVILTALYPEKWQNMYASIMQNNSTPFEMIFVGPNPPQFEMPDNTQFIQTSVNPTQCREIACRAATGEYVIDLADDYTFVPGFLNSFIECAEKVDMDKHVVIGHLGRKWKAKVNSKHLLGDPQYPIVGLYALIKRDIWRGLGGLDRRFRAVQCTHDLILRFYQAGGSYVLGDTKKCLAREQGENRLTREFGDEDSKLISKLWFFKHKFTGTRTDVLHPFSDKDILTRNQREDG